MKLLRTQSQGLLQKWHTLFCVCVIFTTQASILPKKIHSLTFCSNTCKRTPSLGTFPKKWAEEMITRPLARLVPKGIARRKKGLESGFLATAHYQERGVV